MAGLFDDVLSDKPRKGLFDDVLASTQRGLIEDVADLGTSFFEGVGSTARSVKAGAQTLIGSNAGVEETARNAAKAAQTSKAGALTDIKADIAERKAAGDETLWGGIKNVAGAIADNPAGGAQLVAEQLPNAAVTLGGGLAGMKAGAMVAPFLGPLAPLAPIAGGILGMFIGNTAIETGGKAIEKAADGFTDEDRADTLKEGAVKGAVVTGVDALSLGVTKLLYSPVGKAMEAAGAKALADAGVDVTNKAAVAQALAVPAIKAEVASAQTAAYKAAQAGGLGAARGAGALASETLGEGAGEGLGEYAATGTWSPTEAALEAVSSLGQSAAQTAWAKARNPGAEVLPKDPVVERTDQLTKAVDAYLGKTPDAMFKAAAVLEQPDVNSAVAAAEKVSGSMSEIMAEMRDKGPLPFTDPGLPASAVLGDDSVAAPAAPGLPFEDAGLQATTELGAAAGAAAPGIEPTGLVRALDEPAPDALAGTTAGAAPGYTSIPVAQPEAPDSLNLGLSPRSEKASGTEEGYAAAGAAVPGAVEPAGLVRALDEPAPTGGPRADRSLQIPAVPGVPGVPDTVNVNPAAQAGATAAQNATLLAEPGNLGTEMARQRIAAGYTAPKDSLTGKKDVKLSAPRTTAEALQSATRGRVLEDGTPVAFTEVDGRRLPHQRRAGPGQMSRQGYDTIRNIGRIFGKKVVVFESNDPRAADGFFHRQTPDVIYVNRNSEKPHLVVFGHELLHSLRKDNEAAYQALAKTIRLKADTAADLANAPGIKGDLEELTADLTGNRFQEPDFWNQVFKEIISKNGDTEGRKIVTRLGAAAMRVVNAIGRAIGRQPGFEADRFVANLDEVKAAIKTALAQYAQDRYAAAVAMDRGESVSSKETTVASERTSAKRKSYTAWLSYRVRNAAGELETKTIRQDVTDEVNEGADREELADRLYWKNLDGTEYVDIVSGGVEEEPSGRTKRSERRENNASGESPASLEALSRDRVERATGRDRVRIKRNGTVERLRGPDAVDARARPGSGDVIAQMEVGKDKWTVLDQDPALGRSAVARALSVAENVKFREKEVPGRLDNITAYHYSQAPRTELDSSMFGTGLRGSARDEYLNAEDKRRRHRISFYVDKGTGVRPEEGTGGVPHKVVLNNLYDANKDPLKLRANGQAAFESAVLDHGFDGYLDRLEGTQPAQAILLGKRAVKVQAMPPGPVRSTAQVGILPPAKPKPVILNIGLSTRELKGGGELTTQAVRDAIRARGAQIAGFKVIQSDTEPTAVVTLTRPMSAADVDSLAVELSQEAIAVRNDDGTGELYGPQADAWRPFNPEYFVMPNGTRASEGEGNGLQGQGQGQGRREEVRASAKRETLRPEIVETLGKHIKNLLPAERAKLRIDTATHLVELIEQLPSANEMAATAWAGRAKRGWYANSAYAIEHVFGGDGPRFAALLAAMSPQTSVEGNLYNTLSTWRNWVAAGRPTDRKVIKRIMGRSVQGDGTEKSVLDAWVNNSVRALTSEDPSSLVISGPKVNSFMLNLRGYVDEVTNDAWMANYALVDQKIFAGRLNVAGTDPGKTPGYLAMSARVREAAKVLSRLTGDDWTPAEVQETVWSWAKTLYETASVNKSAVEVVLDKEITDELIRSTPDFRTLFHSDVNEQLLRDAGLGDAVASLRTREDPRRAGGQEPAAGGQAGPFAERAQERYELQAARRLDDLRQLRSELSEDVQESAKRVTETPEFKRWFGDSKVVDAEGKPLVMWHGSPVRDFTVFDTEKINANDPDGLYNGFYFTSDQEDANTAGSFPWGRPNAKSPQTRPFYLSIKNPATRAEANRLGRSIRDNWLARHPSARSLQDAVRLELQKRGFDGVVHSPYVTPSREQFERDGRVKLGRGDAELVRAEDTGGVEYYSGGEFITGFADWDEALDQLRHGTFVAFRPEQIKSAIGNDGTFDADDPDIRSSEKRTYLLIHGGSDFDAIDKRMLGRGEPGGIRPLGPGFYGYLIRNPDDIENAVRGALRYTKYAPTERRSVHLFKLDLEPGEVYFAGRVWDEALLTEQDKQARDDYAEANALPPGPSRSAAYDALKEKYGTGSRRSKTSTPVVTEVLGGNYGVVSSPELVEASVNDTGRLQRIGKWDANANIEDLLGVVYEQFTDKMREAADEGLPLFSAKRIFMDSGRSYTPEQRASIDNIGGTVTEQTWKERVDALRHDLGKKLAQGLADQFAPLKDLGAAGKEAYNLARLSKGSSGALEALLHFGKLSLRNGATDADMTGGAIERVFAPLGRETGDFLRWVAAYRAERLAAEDRENLFTAADIAALKTLDQGTTNFDYVLRNGQVTRDRTKIYRDALAIYDEFNQNVLDIAEQSGLIDAETRQLVSAAPYVPFYRVSEEEGGFFGPSMGNSLVRQSAFKRLKGGKDKLAADLFGNVLQNWAHLIDASARNRAAVAALEAATAMDVAYPVPAKAAPKGSVWVMKDGEKVHYKVEDPYTLAAITSLEYSGMRGPIMEALSTMKHWLTVGVTASPAFKIKNLIRDSMTAVAQSELSPNIYKNIRDGWKLTRKDNQDYVSALAGGGLIRFGTMLEGNRSARERQMIKQARKDGTLLENESAWRKLWDTQLEPMVTAYNELGNRSEEINRMSLYKQLRSQGKTHAEASLAARDLLDFSMQGTSTSIRFLSQVVPFFNARVQGLYRLGRGAKENPAKMAIWVGSLALASIALAAAYSDDEDWKKREDWDRNNYWWFKVNGIAYRIPKPFEMGAIATLAERGADFLWDERMTGARYGRVVRDLLMDNLSMNPVPQAVKPVLDIYANRDSFTGRAIESDTLRKLAPDYRYDANTTMLARAASTAGQSVIEATGADRAGVGFLSPKQIDHLIRGYFGWLGTAAVFAPDLMLRAATDQPTRPAVDFVKFATQGLAQSTTGAPSQYVTNLYDQAKIIEEAYLTWSNLRKTGRHEEAREFLEENRTDIVKYKKVSALKRQMGKVNEAIRLIENSRTLDKDEKKARIDRYREQQSRIAERMGP